MKKGEFMEKQSIYAKGLFFNRVKPETPDEVPSDTHQAYENQILFAFIHRPPPGQRSHHARSVVVQLRGRPRRMGRLRLQRQARCIGQFRHRCHGRRAEHVDHTDRRQLQLERSP